MAKIIKAKTINGSDGRALTTAERYDYANELDLYEYSHLTDHQLSFTLTSHLHSDCPRIACSSESHSFIDCDF